MATEQTTERPDYWDGYHQAMLGHDRKPEGGSEYQRGYAEGKAAFAHKVEIRMSSESTTDWQPIETAPRDFSMIEVRWLDDEPLSFSCRRGGDGVFRDLEGKPLYVTPDEWRVSQ